MITVSRLINRIRKETARIFLNKCCVFQLHDNRACLGVEDNTVKMAQSIDQLRESNIALDSEKQSFYKERFAKGDILYYIAHAENVVASGWKRPNITAFYAWEIHRDIRFESAVSMLYDFYVDKDHRGKGLYTGMLRTIIARAETNEHIVIFALSDNFCSLKGIDRAGFQQWFDISHFTKTRKGT